jgi:hypothetical protein
MIAVIETPLNLHNGAHSAGEEARLGPDALLDGDTTVEPIQPSRWQQPISLAQAILSLIVTGVALFGILFAAHARFITLEIRQGSMGEALVEIRKDISDRSRSDEEFRRMTGIQLERLATQAEWQTSWIKAGGEQRK